MLKGREGSEACVWCLLFVLGGCSIDLQNTGSRGISCLVFWLGVLGQFQLTVQLSLTVLGHKYNSNNLSNCSSKQDLQRFPERSGTFSAESKGESIWAIVEI